MSDGWNVALLGATGAVGRALIEMLQECSFPIGHLYLLATKKSAGEVIRFAGKSVPVQNAAEFDWSKAQIAFFVAGRKATAFYAETASDAGCRVIDNSGLFSMDSHVPLIVPMVNPQVLSQIPYHNIVAVADSLTSQLLVAIKPLIEQMGLSRLNVTNMISVSAYGKAAVDDLAGQTAKLLNGVSPEKSVFKKQLAFNLLPLINDEEESVYEERHLVNQIRKILQDPHLPISVSCIQAPVFYGHAQIVHFEALQPISFNQVRSELENIQNIQLFSEYDYPTQVSDLENNAVNIGCIRNDYGIPEIVQFWSVADNIRFTGANMLIKTAELLIMERLH
ncbi:aspartate-semialdehyde dehydrogenase [Candidatus Williamhamiltonella defendens]|uniref:aspartate-semialdehyde dehydrogenase n=1 Tax=Candidatus Williamhamiltonella defendens TaxID=138072 RepID=UPI00130DE6A2|nr:aspartate-semialdehyde dehydrogenase [Candidatus Hamiltonella defensa]